MELGPEYVEAWEKFKFRLTACLIASTVAAAECGCALSWSKSTPLDIKYIALKFSYKFQMF
jgi:hypothetical protein